MKTAHNLKAHNYIITTYVHTRVRIGYPVNTYQTMVVPFICTFLWVCPCARTWERERERFMLPSKHCFLIVHKFHGFLEVPLWKEDATKFLIVLATNIHYEEFLTYGLSSIETYLWNIHINCSLLKVAQKNSKWHEVYTCLKKPLEAFHGKHSNGLDLNHIMFHQYQIKLLLEEQLKRVKKICCFKKIEDLLVSLWYSTFNLIGIIETKDTLNMWDHINLVSKSSSASVEIKSLICFTHLILLYIFLGVRKIKLENISCDYGRTVAKLENDGKNN